MRTEIGPHLGDRRALGANPGDEKQRVAQAIGKPPGFGAQGCSDDGADRAERFGAARGVPAGDLVG